MLEKVSSATLESGCGMQSIADRLARHPDASFLLPFVEIDNETHFLLQVTPEHGLHMLGGKNEVDEEYISCLFRELSEELGEVCFSRDELASFPNFKMNFNVEDAHAEATVVPVEMSFAFANSLIRLSSLEHPLVLFPLKEYFEGRFRKSNLFLKMSIVTQLALCRF